MHSKKAGWSIRRDIIPGRWLLLKYWNRKPIVVVCASIEEAVTKRDRLVRREAVGRKIRTFEEAVTI